MGAGKGGSGCRHHLLSSLVLERAAAVAVSVLLSSRMRVSLAAAAGIVLFRVTCVRRAGSGSAHCFCSPHACENARQWQRAFFVFGLLRLLLPLPPASSSPSSLSLVPACRRHRQHVRWSSFFFSCCRDHGGVAVRVIS